MLTCRKCVEVVERLRDATMRRRNAAGGCCDWSCDQCSAALDVLDHRVDGGHVCGSDDDRSPPGAEHA